MQLTLYPTHPGWKKTDTSKQAAKEIAPKAENLRNIVFRMIKANPMSADEVAATLNIDITTIRPRVSELRNMGKIEDSGVRSRTRSGKRCIVWRVK